MTPPQPWKFRRRQFLQTTGSLIAGGLGAGLVRADDRPVDANPRAISGDPVEPDWQKRLTITVGPSKADLVGATDRVLQAAVDYVTRLGGGTVRILPGVYRLRNSVFLASKVRLLGSGADSVLVKEPSTTTKLIGTGEYWDQEVTVADPEGFQIGDGVRLAGKDPYRKGINLSQRTVIASSGNRLKLDTCLQNHFYEGFDPKIATNFALLQCTKVTDVIIENLAVDGNKAHNEMVDQGMFDDGSIRLDDSNRIVVRGVMVHDSYCDGIVWGTSHDAVVENCVVRDVARLGLHAGSGSQRSLVRGNRVLHGQVGIYFCWAAQHGLYEKNVIEDCTKYGMEFGHSDSDNLIRDNDVRRSGSVGIYLGGENSEIKAFAPNRNHFERNRVIDSGGDDGVALDIAGETEGVVVVKNELRETRAPKSRIGIRLGDHTRDIRCENNVLEGFAVPISDLRKS